MSVRRDEGCFPAGRSIPRREVHIAILTARTERRIVATGGAALP